MDITEMWCGVVVKVKGQVVSAHAMKTLRWSRKIAPLILNFVTRWR
jgi:hypothetical protein